MFYNPAELFRHTEDDRRLRRYAVPYEYMMGMISCWGQMQPDCIALMRLDIPKGAEILCVDNNPPWRCFDVVVRHPSFDPVPAGEVIPVVNAINAVQYIYRVNKLIEGAPSVERDLEKAYDAQQRHL